jgi:hypothetical protein
MSEFNILIRLITSINPCDQPEVVLSALIASFKFELGPEEHLWSAAGIVKPHVRHKDGTIDPVPSLRMKVTLVDE